MTDKEKIKAEIKRLINKKDPNTYLGVLKIEAYKDVLSFIDSMQEKSKECMYTKDNYTDEDRKVLCDGCEEECEYNKKQPSIPDIVDEHFDEMLGEETASEDFETALEKKVREAQDWTYIEEEGGECPLNEEFGADDLEEFARWGADWQKEQFEKNRLKHCNSITNEQAELEQGFIDQHLDKYNRMPTYLDAIEYGIKLKEQQMMKDAVKVKIINASIISLPENCNFKVGNKVILIKEDS